MGLRNRQWKTVALVIGIGMIAALSVLPYSLVVKRMHEGKELIPFNLTLPWIWNVVSEALGSASEFMRPIWIGLFAIGTLVAIIKVLSRFGKGNAAPQRDLALFSVTAMLVATLGFWVFLKILSFPTQPRYYLPLMVFVAVCLDVIFGVVLQEKPWRIFRVGAFLCIIALILAPIWQKVHIRQTNIDLVVTDLEQQVGPDDLILVNPWYCGATFDRYYRGRAPWITLPPLERIRFQPLILFKKQMVSLDPIRPVIDKIGKTLESGGRVFLVGGLSFPEKGQVPPSAPPAPHAPWGWDHDAYAEVWAMQAGYYIQTHALHVEALPPVFDGPVNHYENLRVMVVKGWKPG